MSEMQRLRIAADDRLLAQVRDFVGRACSGLALPPRSIANVRLAVDEACTNVIKHAYADRAGEITVEIGPRRGWLEIRILDQGQPFDGRVEIPHLGRYIDGKRRGGLGVFLMHRVMDDVRYQSTPAGNEWLLRKRLPRPGGGFGRSLRFRYATRAALVLLGITLLACAPLWVLEGRQRRGADEQALRALAFGLAEAARPVLLAREELSPAQTRLFENVHTLVRQEPRLLTVSVVDADGIIWAADRPAAAFTPFVRPSGLGEPDAHRVCRGVQHTEGQPVLHLEVPVRVSTGAEGRDLGHVYLALRGGDTEAAVRAARLRLVGIALLLDVLGTVLVATLLGTFLRPIQRLIDGLRNAGQGDAALEVEGPEEIGAIAAAFNDMQARFREAREGAAEHERLQQEMQVAQEIQTSILPQQLPDIPGFELARLYRPAAEIGGDYYDFLDVGEHLTGVVVADVAGKGVPGSLVMTMIRTALRMEARNNTNAGDVLSRMHAFVSADMRKGMFVTMFYVILDSRHRVVSYACAGHNPMLLYRAASDETFFLNPRGIPVGLALPDAALFERSLDVERLRLRQDDLLLLYTDGLTEARNTSGEQYGEARLLQAIRQWGRGSAPEFVSALERDLAEFTAGAAPSDDLTLVAIKEKQGVPEVQGGLRQKLSDLVERQGLSVVEACRSLKVSPSTYYRLKRQESADDLELQHLSLEKRELLLRLVAAHPELGPKELADLLRAPEWGAVDAAPTLVHAELRRLDLQTTSKRLAYARSAGTPWRRADDAPPVANAGEGMLPAAPPAAALPSHAGADRPDAGRSPSPAASPPGTARGYEGFVAYARSDGTPWRQADDAPPVANAGEGMVPAAAPAAAPPSNAGADTLDAGRSPSPAASPPGAARGDEGFMQAGGLRALVEVLDVERGIACVDLEGCVDSGSCGALEALLHDTAQRWTRLVLDLTSLAYVSSRGWGLFASDPDGVRARGGEIVLCGMRREVHEVYRMLGFESVLRAFADRTTALAALAGVVAAAGAGAGAAAIRPARGAASDAEAATPKAVALAPRRLPLLDGLQDVEGDWESLRVRTGALGEGGEVTLVDLQGILDTVSAYKFERVLQDLVERGACRLLVDLSCTEFVSSAGWGSFTAHLAPLRSRGGDLALFGMSPEVARIYDLLGLRAVLPSFDLLAEALQSFGIAPPEPVAAPAGTPHPEPGAAGSASSAAPGGDEPAAHEVAEPEVRARSFGELEARLEPFGSSGRARRLSLSGRWSAAESGDLDAWLCTSDTSGQLLLVDTCALATAEPEAWSTLERCAQRLGERGTQVHVLRSEAGPQPSGLRLQVHTSLEAALLAWRRPAPGRLIEVRLPASEFEKDGPVRREGWTAYLHLLREACAEENP